MSDIIEFAIIVIIISASGVMSPGPLFAANITYGLKQGTKAGIKIAIGHSLVELPLVILLGIGILSLEIFPEFKTIISILGAITLFVFAFIQIKSTLKKNEKSETKLKQGPIITGVLLSALNPFFIIWWLTIGLKLISDAMAIWAFVGILIVFVLHVWMDFVWLGSTAFLISKSKKIISNTNYKIIMLALSAVLIYFGITFLTDVIN
ncbi:MAG: LysE family translocator [Nitrosopumilus sp.]|nr:lysine transporter LysE [Nitrosopumilus sp.]MCH1519412.1 LysE family translocator [Nitrosopumilus sp.]MCH1549112.1 LysE family translocator [Nitrosopumilus sp.]MDC0387987.1 LysE family translocator [Nitrosopumilus sp.]RCL30843.1 MAG: lysine transporter LysE [Nitrosopumilus sp.]|tara:strand:+ start:726 stop:1346 length:621 start_codon:yes stop_codon:yes gene_type:complete